MTRPVRSRHAIAASVLAMLAAPAALAQYNSSTNTATITYRLSSAVQTDTGEPLVLGFDIEHDTSPDFYFDEFYSFTYSMGDGSGSFGGSSFIAGQTYTYPDEEYPDLSSFVIGDDATITVFTHGQSSLPGSNGSAGSDARWRTYYAHFIYDENFDAVPITLTFDYDYTFSMELIEEAGSGQANGFFTGTAYASYYNSGDEVELGDFLQEWYGGPGIINNWTGSGQLVIDVPAGESYFGIEIRTNMNSTTLVDEAPECPFDLNGDGILDNGDIGAFVAAFLAGDLAADFNGDNILDNGDIGAFVAGFLAGC